MRRLALNREKYLGYAKVHKELNRLVTILRIIIAFYPAHPVYPVEFHFRVIEDRARVANCLAPDTFADFALQFRQARKLMREQLKKFIEAMDENSIAIIPAAHEARRSYDTEFKFRQDSDFWYLTGFPEPDAIAVIDGRNNKKPYTLFVRPRDPEMETWFGRRQGVAGALKNFGADHSSPIDKFASELGKMLDGHDTLYYRFGVDEKLDLQILGYLSEQRVRRLKTAYPPHTIVDPTVIIGEMRLHKTEKEVALMQTAADIAVEAHILAMKKVKPGMNEFQVESLMESYIRDKGASGVAYNSIIGGGDNATILHYVENNMPLKDGDLILIDAGAEYEGYASDITRTFPVNGKYSKAQREVYDVVLDVQKQCIEYTKTGNTVKGPPGILDRTPYRGYEETRTAKG